MKNILAFIIIALLTTGAAHAQADWVAHQGDNRISVKFPFEPGEAIPGTYISAKKDSSVAYVFTIVDFVKVAGVDSVALAPVKATPMFASQLKGGMKGSLPDVELSDFTIGTWKGFTSYTSSGLDSKKKKYDFFMFIIGNKMYSLTTVRSANIPDAERDAFFNSVTLSN